ncbi:MAG: hypothetical protein KAS71_10770 [Bacteroidales bacterium]|nr:hypothetical protein [Bacteroidales bacterium]
MLSSEKELAESIRYARNIQTARAQEDVLKVFEDLKENIQIVYSTIDFKKFILKKRTGITQENLDYVLSNDLNRMQLVTSFACIVKIILLNPKILMKNRRKIFGC